MVLGAGLLLVACSEEDASKPAAAVVTSAAAAPAPADQAPEIALKMVGTDKIFRLSEHRGKVVLVDFWATWCGPCRMAIPHLIELQKQYGKKGFTMLGVSLDQQGEPVVAPFYKQWNMNYPVVIDSDGSAARNYGGIRSIPTAVLINKQGKIVNGFVGYRPKEVFEEAIKAELAKQ